MKNLLLIGLVWTATAAAQIVSMSIGTPVFTGVGLNGPPTSGGTYEGVSQNHQYGAQICVAGSTDTVKTNRDSGPYTGCVNMVAALPLRYPAGSITAATWTAGIATYSDAGHGLTTGARVQITGASASGYNVANAAVTVLSSSQFTVAITSNPGTYTSGGTVLANDGVSITWPATTGHTAGDSWSVAVSGVPAAGQFMQRSIGAVVRTDEAKLGDIINVTDYGAACDGVTDDTLAVQAAINAAAGGTVYFPNSPAGCLVSAPGIYAWPANDGLKMLGQASTTNFGGKGGGLLANPANPPAVVLTDYAQDLRVDDLLLDCNSAAQTGFVAVVGINDDLRGLYSQNCEGDGAETNEFQAPDAAITGGTGNIGSTSVTYNVIGPVVTTSGVVATSGGTWTGGYYHPALYSWEISANGTPDSFTWSLNGGPVSAAALITGSAQNLSQGVQITFASTTGNTLGATGTISIEPVQFGRNETYLVMFDYGTPDQELIASHFGGASIGANPLTLFSPIAKANHTRVRLAGNNNYLHANLYHGYNNGKSGTGWGWRQFPGEDSNAFVLRDFVESGNASGGELLCDGAHDHSGGNYQGESGPPLQLGMVGQVNYLSCITHDVTIGPVADVEEAKAQNNVSITAVTPSGSGAALTTATQPAIGSTSILVDSATGINVGQGVNAPGIPVGTTVSSIAAAPTIALSSATTAVITAGTPVSFSALTIFTAAADIVQAQIMSAYSGFTDAALVPLNAAVAIQTGPFYSATRLSPTTFQVSYDSSALGAYSGGGTVSVSNNHILSVCDDTSSLYWGYRDGLFAPLVIMQGVDGCAVFDHGSTTIATGPAHAPGGAHTCLGVLNGGGFAYVGAGCSGATAPVFPTQINLVTGATCSGNAVAGAVTYSDGSPVTIASGLVVTIPSLPCAITTLYEPPHTLPTFQISGDIARGIISHNTTSLAQGYPSGAPLTLQYNLGNWDDVSQTGQASQQLDNLGLTAINQNLLPAGVQNLGSSAAPWQELYLSGTCVAVGGGVGCGITQLNGDVTAGPASGNVAATLASVGSAGSCGDSSHTCAVTYDAKGRETARANDAIGGITVTAGTGITVSGSPVVPGGSITITNSAPFPAGGLSVTKTVRAAGGTADCTLIFTGGLLTGGTC